MKTKTPAQKIIHTAKNKAQLIIATAELVAKERIADAEAKARDLIITRADLERTIQEETKKGIKETVNGKLDRLDIKIDTHNERHERDMIRVMPIIEAYEASEKFANNAKRKGVATVKVMAAISGFVTVVGSAVLVLEQFWPLKHIIK